MGGGGLEVIALPTGQQKVGVDDGRRPQGRQVKHEPPADRASRRALREPPQLQGQSKAQDQGKG